MNEQLEVKNYYGLLSEIERVAKYKNDCIKGKDKIMGDYADARLRGLIDAFNILFDTYFCFEYCYEKYIWRITFMEKKFSKIIHRITVITDEEIKQAELENLKKLNNKKVKK